jgi:hypothetical protein
MLGAKGISITPSITVSQETIHLRTEKYLNSKLVFIIYKYIRVYLYSQRIHANHILCHFAEQALCKRTDREWRKWHHRPAAATTRHNPQKWRWTFQAYILSRYRDTRSRFATNNWPWYSEINTSFILYLVSCRFTPGETVHGIQFIWERPGPPPEPIQTLWRRDKSLAPNRNLTTIL